MPIRKLFLTIILVLLFVSPVFAQARYSLQASDAVEISTDNVLPASTWVYGWKIYADETSSWAALYDNATATADLAACDETTRVDEIGEATQYDSVTVWFPKPIFFSEGVSIKMTTGVAYVFYGPPPTD